MPRKGFTERIIESGARFVSRAAETVMKDPRGQDAVARAVGLAQRGKRRLDEAQERLMKAAGIPGRQEYQDLAKQLARIKRKTREVAERIESARAGAPRPAAGEPHEAASDPDPGAGDVAGDAGPTAAGAAAARGERV